MVLWLTLGGSALVAGTIFAITMILGNLCAGETRPSHHLALIAAMAVLAGAVNMVIFLFIAAHLNRQLRDAQAGVESVGLQLRTALDNMQQGLKVYDATGRLITCNHRYIEMFGLSSSVVKPGAHFRDVMQHRKDRGTFEGDVQQFCDVVMAGVAAGRTTKKVMDVGDGRALRILNTPLPRGGWIATIEDVTEKRDLAEERDRNYAFLREIIDHIPWLITVKDAHTRKYLLANRVADEYLARSGESIVGKTAFDILSPEVAQTVTEDDDGMLRSQERLVLEARVMESAGGVRYVNSSRVGICDKSGEPRYIINVIEDVTERRRADEEIAHMAHYDLLTDLPNRTLFREQIAREYEKARQGNWFALIYIDVDEFKSINDSLGHHIGDELLKALAGRLRDCLSPGDLVARFGGDEFAVIRSGGGDRGAVEVFVNRIQEAIRRPYRCRGHQLSVDASIGIALAPEHGRNLDQLVKNADLAMYSAKADGRRTHRFFEPAMEASANARLAMEQDLRRAVAEGGFEVYYQPFVDLRSDRVSGCEALLRWRHPSRGLISSTEFIPVAEYTSLIVEIGDWVLTMACREAARWPSHIRIAVNVSPVQLKYETLPLKIASALATSGLDPRRLELEITEAVLIRDDEAALAILHQLRDLGVRISLDDFGTGYSSLSYLRRFPFDKIKIDRSFVADVTESRGARVIVQAVVNIATVSNMTTVAEGVETEAQRELLRRLGCTEMQGYLFSKPKAAAEVARLFQESGAGRVAR